MSKPEPIETSVFNLLSIKVEWRFPLWLRMPVRFALFQLWKDFALGSTNIRISGRCRGVDSTRFTLRFANYIEF